MERKKIRKNSHTSKKSKASLDTNPDSNNEKDKENKKSETSVSTEDGIDNYLVTKEVEGDDDDNKEGCPGTRCIRVRDGRSVGERQRRVECRQLHADD